MLPENTRAIDLINLDWIKEDLEKKLLVAIAPNSKLTLFEKMEAYNEFVYDTMQILDNASVCKKECSFCCYNEVKITQGEADYISNKTGNVQTNKPALKGALGPCPFLDTNSQACSIYLFRPLVCRTMLTFDYSELCKNPEAEHQVFTIHMWNELNKDLLINLGATMGTYVAGELEKIFHGNEKDIREYFQ